LRARSSPRGTPFGLVAKRHGKLLEQSRELGALLPFKPVEQSLLIGNVVPESRVDQPRAFARQQHRSRAPVRWIWLTRDQASPFEPSEALRHPSEGRWSQPVGLPLAPQRSQNVELAAGQSVRSEDRLVRERIERDRAAPYRKGERRPAEAREPRGRLRNAAGSSPTKKPPTQESAGLFTDIATAQAQRKQALAELFAGRTPPRDESGRFATKPSFDGGARATVPTPVPPEKAHAELLGHLVAASRVYRGTSF
jgi:hypothetical protein